MKKYDYVQFFNKALIQDIVVKLINEGFSESYISYIIGCEMESVIDFKVAKEKSGFIFRKDAHKERLRINNKKGHKSIAMKNRTDNSRFYFSGNEMVIRPLAYKDYLEKDKKKNRDIRKERIEKAKETVEKLKKKRKKQKFL